MKLKKGSKEAKAFMAKIRGKKKTAAKKVAVKKVATKKKSIKKKISGEKHTDIKSHNYKINISGINKDNLENLKERLKFDETLTMFLDDLRYQLKNKYLTIAQKNAIKKHITTAKKQILNNKKQISLIKQSIK